MARNREISPEELHAAMKHMAEAMLLPEPQQQRIEDEIQRERRYIEMLVEEAERGNIREVICRAIRYGFQRGKVKERSGQL